MLEDQRRLLSVVRSEGVGSMTFLLKKVDENCFKVLDHENSSLIQVCLRICCEEGSRENVGTELLISELIKRILILYEEKDVALDESLIQSVLDYCVLHWDSLAGAVSYNCVDIFSHILSNHTKLCGVCRLRNVCSVASNIIQKIVQSGSNSKARLKCIKLLLDSFNIVAEVNISFVEEAYASLKYANLSVAASELIVQDMCFKKNNYEFHLQQITDIFVKNCEISRSAVKDRLIPIILKSSSYPPNILLDIVSALIKNSLENPQNFEALLIIVHRLIYKPPVQEKTPTWLNFLEPQLAYQALVDPCSQVRVALWSLITDHPKKTQPFTTLDFDLMKFFLTTNCAEQLPTVRQKILSGFRNVLVRLCEFGENHKLEHEDGLRTLNHISDFMKFIINLAFDCISSEANFPRRLMGLYFIEFIFASKYLETKQKSRVLKYLELEKELTQDRFHKLLSNLDNEYQICQMTAMKLLRVLYPRENIDFDFKKYTEDTLVLINSVRTQDTLSSGYRLQYSLINVPGADITLLEVLLERCESNLTRVKEKLMNITTHSLHPLLNAISYLLDERRSDIMEYDREFLDTYTNKLLRMCFEIAEIVTPVVHSLSPEGFIPEEELEVLAKSSNTQVQVVADRSQLLLACCWRAHKFVSSIFTIVVNGSTDLKSKVIEDMAKYFWLQLTECKHCGAFESAVDGFQSLCSYLWKVKDDSLPHPARWAEEITLALEGKNDSQKLCSTRRSAGVPHLVTSIMASEPLDREGHKSIFSRVFDSLLSMEAKTLEYRVHSLNVLKAIVSSSKLGERILFAIEKICVVSINSCSAESWSERNAGAQLAAALRIRIFGVSRNSQKEHEVDSKNKLSAFDFFSRYPALYEKLHQQLRETTTDDFKCYPILIFLSHLTPTIAEKFPLAPFIPACLKILFTSKSEKLRNLTAATITSISQEQDLFWVLHQAKKCSEKYKTESVAHSVLILVYYSYRKLAKIKKQNEVVSELLPCVLPFLDQPHLCDYNLNILYTILNTLEVRFQPVMAKEINLTWRPVAASNVFQKNVLPHIEEKALRFEYYRTFQKVSEFLGRDELLDWACLDLLQCKIEREFFEVLSFLLNNLESMTVHLTQKLEKALLTPKLFTSLKSWLLSKKLYYSICVPINMDSEDFSWLKNVSENDEDDSLKEIALEVSDFLLSSCKTPDFIAHLSLFLQDECESIRNMAAKIISKRFLQRNMPLSSEICFRLVMENVEVHQNYINLSKYSERKRDALFDVCNSRPYAEERVFGDNHFVMGFISNVFFNINKMKNENEN